MWVDERATEVLKLQQVADNLLAAGRRMIMRGGHASLVQLHKRFPKVRIRSVVVGAALSVLACAVLPCRAVTGAQQATNPDIFPRLDAD